MPDNFEECLQAELQDAAEEYLNNNKNATVAGLEKALNDRAQSFVISCVDEYSDEIIDGLGRDLLTSAGISVYEVKEDVAAGFTLSKIVKLTVSKQNLEDAIDAYKEAGDTDDIAKHEAIKNMTNGMINITGTLMSEVPVTGHLYQQVTNLLLDSFDAGFNMTTRRVAKIKYTEAMCDYYTGDITLEELYNRINSIYNPDERDRLWALVEIEKELAARGESDDTIADKALPHWKEEGKSVYDDMNFFERLLYGKEWSYDTEDETKDDMTDAFDSAGKAAAPRDPLIIDLGKKGIELTDVDDGVYFDLDNNGFAEKTAWIGSEDGFLALDRNGNGTIDNGGELFGDQFILKNGQKASSGFEALADLDDNGDGVIDKNDAAFGNLRVWIDANHNGISEEGELKTLDELNIESISLNHVEKDETDLKTGTIVSESSDVKFKDGTVRDISEHWFKVNTFDSEDRNYFDEDIDFSSVDSFGNVMSLNHAIMEDETGELLELVNRFKESDDYVEKRILIKKILYFITDASDISPNSRGGNIDARDLQVIERFMGRDFEGLNGTSPNVNAANILKNLYSMLENMYFNLLNKETETGEYLDLILKRWNENGKYLDISDFENTISEMIENGDNVDNIISGVASWLKQYDTAFQDNKLAELKKKFPEYAELLDRVDNTNVLLGSENNDNLVGTNNSDIICGGQGDDVMSGGAGNDILYGGEGNDTLDGGAGNDMLYGGEGNDVYVFGKGYGNDVIIDESGRNTLRFKGLKPSDILVNGTGDNDVTIRIKGTNDTLVIKDFCKDGEYGDYDLEFDGGIKMHVTDKNSPFRRIYGGDGDDVLKAVVEDSVMYGFDGDDTIYGSDGNDVIYGGEGNDTIYAGAGNDIINGGDGDDILDGGMGDDLLFGGTGNDTYIFGKNYGTDIISDEGGMSIIKIKDFILSELEFVQAGEELIITSKSTGDRLIVKGFTQNPDSYQIQIGDETIDIKEQLADPQKDMIVGTDDYDYVVGSDADESIFAGSEGDRILAGAGNDMIFGDSGNDALFGEDGNDYIFGGDGDDYINGGAGDDIIAGGKGNDFMDGGAGDDVYFFNLGDGNDSIMDIMGMNTIIFGEGITAASIKAYRSNWNDLIITFEGSDDTLIIKNYCIDENARNFTLVFADGTVTEATSEDSPLKTIYGTMNGDYEPDIYENGTIIVGQDGDDHLIGSEQDDLLYGEAGDDILIGNGGNDYLAGGTGNDYLAGGAGDDTYIYKKGDGIDTISDNEGTNTINIEGYTPNQIRAYRSNWNDLLIEFIGSEGMDKIIIEGFFISEENRNFYLTFNGGGRVHATAGNSPLRTIYGTEDDDYMVAMDDHGVTLIGESGNDTINGGNGNDTLNGGEGDDRLLGNGGNDTLHGGRGNDYLAGGAGNDTYIFNLGDGTDTINDGEGINTIAFGAGFSAEKIKVYRSNWNDLLITFEGTDDKLIIQGYFADDANRNFNITFADGTHYDYDDIENPIHHVHATENDDWMSAWSDDGIILYGDGGNDTLNGGAGDDILSGGSGNDTLNGGAGDDVYLFGIGDGNDVINDTEGVNTIRFQGITSDMVTFTTEYVGDSIRLTASIAGSEDSITINDYKQENYLFEFADEVRGTVDENAVFEEIVPEDLIDPETEDILYDAFEVINGGENLYSMTDLQAMKLTEEIAGFGGESNVSDGVIFNMADATSTGNDLLLVAMEG